MVYIYRKVESFTSGEQENPSTPNVSVSDDSRIFGTWKGSYYGDSVELVFKEDGHLTENWDDNVSVTLYTLKDGIMTLDEELGTVLSNTLYSSFSCSFISNTKIKLYSEYDSITLTKQ